MGCASAPEQEATTPEEIIEKATHQKVFTAPYDEVWKAAHAAIKYTIASENQDFGVMETDFIKSVDGYIPPFRNKPQYASSRYKLIITFVKGKKNISGQEMVRVNIEKKIEAFKDFISEVKTLTSDGYEEKVIFYRMEREIVIDQALKRALQ